MSLATQIQTQPYINAAKYTRQANKKSHLDPLQYYTTTTPQYDPQPLHQLLQNSYAPKTQRLEDFVTRHTPSYQTTIDEYLATEPKASIRDIRVHTKITRRKKDIIHDVEIRAPQKPPRLRLHEPFIALASHLSKEDEFTPTPHHVFKTAAESPLDRFFYVSVIGADAKITPQGEVKFIEINGLHMGMKGFRELGLSIPQSPVQALKNAITRTTPPQASDELKAHLQSYGKHHLAALGAGVYSLGVRPHRIKGAQNVLPYAAIYDPRSGESLVKGFHQSYEHAFYLGQRLAALNQVFADKFDVDELFANLRQYKPPAHLFTARGKEQFLDTTDTDQVVVKTRRGARGNGVDVMSINEFYRIEPTGTDHIIEPFIDSKPIRSNVTNNYHDGCMRYVAVLEANTTWDVTHHHFGGYWRLSPEPLNADFTYNGSASAKANLSAGAIPQAPTRNELRAVKHAVEETLPTIHENAFLKP